MHCDIGLRKFGYLSYWSHSVKQLNQIDGNEHLTAKSTFSDQKWVNCELAGRELLRIQKHIPAITGLSTQTRYYFTNWSASQASDLAPVMQL